MTCRKQSRDAVILSNGNVTAALRSVLGLLPQRQHLCELNRAQQSPGSIMQVFVKTAGKILYYHEELRAGSGFKL